MRHKSVYEGYAPTDDSMTVILPFAIRQNKRNHAIRSRNEPWK